jgi:hypothetical protein
MSWEQITTWLDQFTDKPIVYWTLCVVVGIVGALVVLSKTSLGRKAIIQLTSLYHLGDRKANETLEKVKEVELLAKDKIEALKGEYEQKVACLVSIVNFYEESVFVILEDIPNAKVQTKLANFKKIYIQKKEEIKATIGEIYQDYNLALERKEDEIRKEYEDKIAYLENQIAQVSLYLNEIKKEEANDGQGEETINTNPTEEEIQGD